MALTTPETIGFCEEVVQFMSTNSAALTAKGLTVTNWISELTTEKNELVSKNDAQENAKADLRVKTSQTNAAQVTAYDSASSKLDAVIGTLGKKSELGKQAARLRSARYHCGGPGAVVLRSSLSALESLQQACSN